MVNNLSYNKGENNEELPQGYVVARALDEITSMKDLVAPTEPQKPDIVLQLTKNDLQQGMKMTYLFDAKYRIGGRDNGVDIPPKDAINQMHRYRDVIYYEVYDTEVLKKEVIGGYILFPGDGQKKDVKVSKFYKTIERVNIGAFPLRPKDVKNRELLERFIAELIHTKSYETIAHVIPQKGAYVEVGNPVLYRKAVSYYNRLAGPPFLYALHQRAGSA